MPKSPSFTVCAPAPSRATNAFDVLTCASRGNLNARRAVSRESNAHRARYPDYLGDVGLSRAGLDVAVDDAVRVDVLQRHAELREDPERRRLGRPRPVAPPSRHPLFQVAALAVLHHDADLAAARGVSPQERLEVRDDVRMSQRGEELGLLPHLRRPPDPNLARQIPTGCSGTRSVLLRAHTVQRELFLPIVGGPSIFVRSARAVAPSEYPRRAPRRRREPAPRRPRAHTVQRELFLPIVGGPSIFVRSARAVAPSEYPRRAPRRRREPAPRRPRAHIVRSRPRNIHVAPRGVAAIRNAP